MSLCVRHYTKAKRSHTLIKVQAVERRMEWKKMKWLKILK